MKSERKSSHKPGAQGHDSGTLSAIERLRSQHSDMMGNQANPDYDERVANKPVTEKLYKEQAPKDYGNRQITNHPKGVNKSSVRRRRGDVGGTEDY